MFYLDELTLKCIYLTDVIIIRFEYSFVAISFM